MQFVFSDNAKTTLAAELLDSTADDTVITVAAGTGGLFATPDTNSANDQAQPLTITDGTNTEMVYLKSREGDDLTIRRRYHGYNTFAFAAGAKVEARLTAYAMNEAFGMLIYLQQQIDALDLRIQNLENTP